MKNLGSNLLKSDTDPVENLDYVMSVRHAMVADPIAQDIKLHGHAWRYRYAPPVDGVAACVLMLMVQLSRACCYGHSLL